MKKILFLSIALLSHFNVSAKTTLEELNAKVEEQKVQYYWNYGIDLNEEQTSLLKVKLVAKDILENTSNLSIQDKVFDAVETFELYDPKQQTSLLIEVTACNGCGLYPQE
ncbi:hypothetical protein [Pseudoalteromonas denitrificans]|uniref:Uncharacterized protein n=1 Tax=Pseudoalteromonas denitrificans DSM 6059 TaxID=1123010 RepID=A0A1I1RS60_9GAMM|nr:hypothetical protein [Pseudoalteromonas denitrificans]SFD37209.1 hypothetical protein SAMN02745724_04327 [Pseudoalteromonas denitrificans DSM 6059]